MRFNYRKIETAFDRVQSKSTTKEIPICSTCKKKSYNCSKKMLALLVLNGVVMLSIGFFFEKIFKVSGEVKENYTKVRVTVHEEPIEKHVWLNENLMEIKTISW